MTNQDPSKPGSPRQDASDPDKSRRRSDAFLKYVDRLNAGEPIDPEEIRSSYPDLAEELIERLRDFEGLGGAERPAPVPSAFGGYRIVRELGRGGMGVVYEAVETILDRPVALKVLPGGLTVGQKAVARFRREARIVGQLSHPNIVSVYGTGIENGTPYIAMDLVRGQTLENVLAKHRPPPGEDTRNWATKALTALSRAFEPSPPKALVAGLAPAASSSSETVDVDPTRMPSAPETPSSGQGGSSTAPAPDPVPADTEGLDLTYAIRMARAFADVADGLQHAHTKGIVHRDLKPSNLILDPKGNLRILDFGIARLEGQEGLTLSGEVVGTPRYMSPEQARGSQDLTDQRTDVYSLGATLYEVLTLAPPFDAPSMQETIQQILHRDPRPLRALNPRIPRDLETIVLKCLAKDPAERYGTAEALSQDLRRFSRGDAIEARPETFGEKLKRRVRRNKGKLAIAAALLGLGLAATYGFYSSARSAGEARLAAYDPLVIDASVKLQMSGILLHRAMGFAWSKTGYDIGQLASGKSEEGESELVQNVVKVLEAQCAAVPERADAFFHLARGHALSGDEGKARKALAKAVELGFVPAMALEADLEGGAKADSMRARILASAARSPDGAWVEAWMAAKQAEREQRWEDAERAFEKLVDTLVEFESSSKPAYLGSSLDAYLGLGLARLRLEKYVEAREVFLRASGKWSQVPELNILIGVTYLAEGNDRKAEEEFLKANKKSLGDEAAQLIVHLYAIFFKRRDKAFEWTARLSPGYFKSVWMAQCFIAYGRFVEAEPHSSVLSRLRPSYALSYLTHAQTLLGLADYEGAAAMARKAQELAPQSSVPFLILSDAHRLQGRMDLCESDLEAAVKAEPTAVAAHYYLGLTYLQAGKLLDAAAAVRHSIEHSTGVKAGFLPPGEQQLALGKILEILGDLEGSRKAIGEALELAKDPAQISPQWIPVLASCHFTAGNRAEAVRILEGFVERVEDGALKLDGGTLARVRGALEGFRTAMLPDLATFATVDQAIAKARRTQLAGSDGPWKFFRGVQAPSGGLEWTTAAFDDSGWESGAPGFGYGDDDDATLLEDMRGKYTSVYVRRVFEVDDPKALGEGILSVLVDDGFVAYLNGREVARLRAPSGEVLPFDALATEEAPEPLGAIEARFAPAEWLRRGKNILALQGLNVSPASSDFSLNPGLLVETETAGDNGRQLLAGLRGAATGPDAADRVAYLEGRLLQLEGKHAEAVKHLRAALRGDHGRVKPALALVTSLTSIGGFAEAVETLEKCLAATPGEMRRLWTLWASISLSRLSRSPRDLLGAMPSRATARVKPSAIESPHQDDMRWLLTELSEGRPLRILCGQFEPVKTGGVAWSADRFYLGGERFLGGRQSFEGDIAGTRDAPLYRSERYFGGNVRAPITAYEIPLPPGKHRVTLHFAEIYHQEPGKRLFDVLLEGKAVLENYDPGAKGFATADVRSFEVEVTDGLLEIGVRRLLDYPKFSAIEVEPAH